MVKNFMMNVLYTIGVVIAVSVVGFTAIFVSMTVKYINRGFTVKNAIEWTTDDIKNKLPKREQEQEKNWFPMANANVDWVLLHKEP